MEEHLEDLSWTRQILIVDHMPSHDMVKRILDELPISLSIGYGPIQNTFLTCCRNLTGDGHESEEASIGLPIPHTQVFVLNEARQPVPVGMHGDLWIGGDGLALSPSSATDPRFTKSPFTSCEGLLFRTGTTARWLPDGGLALKSDLKRPKNRNASEPKITKLWENEGARPVFFIATGGDDRTLCHKVAELATKDFSAYLIDVGFDRPDRNSVEITATACLDLVQSSSPEGVSPIIIGGPLGGVTAYEMAQQSGEASKPFEMVTLIDTLNPAAEDITIFNAHPPLANYVPRAHSGAVTLFRLSDSPEHQAHSQLGWDGLVRGGLSLISATDLTNLSVKLRGLMNTESALDWR